MFRILLKTTFLILLLNGVVIAKTIKPEAFFNQLKSLNQKKLPDFFKVKLESSVIELQKKTFPPEMIEFNQEPTLYLFFKKGHHPLLKLEGVLEYYANYFAPYEEVIQNTSVFIGVDNFNTYKKFSKEYIIKAVKTSYGYRFKVREREGLLGDYAEYFYNKDMKLNLVKFYQDGKLNGNMKAFFKEIENNKIVPSKIVINYEKPEIGGLKEFSITFTDYDINSKLGEKFFLK